MLTDRLLAATLLVAIATPAAAAGCGDLLAQKLPDVTIDAANAVSPGLFAPAGAKPVQTDRDFCRVQGTIRPTSTSNIKFELWLPQAWNGNFFQSGNGGLAGIVPHAALAGALARGYAAAGTDDGTSPQGSSDFLSDPERVIDYNIRAAHLTALAAQALTRAHYGRAPAHRYFVGGSKGGQEALMEAQRYPQDFDGIVANYPGLRGPHLQAQMLWATQQMNRGPGALLSEAKLVLLHDAAIAQCAGSDGGLKTDGFLTYPPACRFDPASLRCTGADAATCLTAEEVKTAAAIYRGPGNPRTGENFDSGHVPGSEGPARGPVHGWTGYYGSFVKQFVAPNIAQNILHRKDWDYRSFDFDRDMATLEEKSQAIMSWSADLRAFKARGGKLIIVHGWDDPMVPARHSPLYFDRVVADQQTDPSRTGRSALDETRSFFRLFMVPGMGHGPSVGLRPLDSLASLVAWVEQGTTPELLPAAQFVEDDPAKGTVLTRALCPWPEIMQATPAGAFACQRPREPGSLKAARR